MSRDLLKSFVVGSGIQLFYHSLCFIFSLTIFYTFCLGRYAFKIYFCSLVHAIDRLISHFWQNRLLITILKNCLCNVLTLI